MEEEKEADKFMKNALKVAKKLEGREIVNLNSHNQEPDEKVEEELEKLRRSLGITVKKKVLLQPLS